MVQTRYIHFRVTIRQFEQIKANADAEGFKTVSEYLRHLALQFNTHAQVKLNEIQKTTNKILEELKHGNTATPVEK